MIRKKIIAMLNGSEARRKKESLFSGEISSYDEGTKDYIETSRLLDFASEFLWKAKEKANRPSQVDGLNNTKPPLDYQAYYG